MKVCVTGKESSSEAIYHRLAGVLDSCDQSLCEIRLDYCDFSPQEALDFLQALPEKWCSRLIITQRRKYAGSASGCTWDHKTWQEWWQAALVLQNWYVGDLDWQKGRDWGFLPPDANVLFSYHGSIEALDRDRSTLVQEAKKFNAGIKIAAPVHSAEDLARLAKIRAKIPSSFHRPVVAVAMGIVGRAWRWSQSLAGDWSYFSFTHELQTDAGQSSWQELRPFLSKIKTKPSWPKLYILWCMDCKNKKGEEYWNSFFLSHGLHSRYISIPCDGSKATEHWKTAALFWMEKAGVHGASVTRPFKELMAQGSGLPAVNTVTWSSDRKWNFADTDGRAVLDLFPDSPRVGIIGGGGAGKAVAHACAMEKIPYFIWRRDGGGFLKKLESSQQWNIFVSTWPGEEQHILVSQLEARLSSRERNNIQCIVDAQFYLSESPLAHFCKKNNITYLWGDKWWMGQARGQALHWFPRRHVLTELKEYIPRSKSETIRALAIASLFPGKWTIQEPSVCDDVIYFREAMEALGVRITECHGLQVQSSGNLVAPKTPIFVGESATALRFLMVLACVMKGEKLIVDAGPSLRTRPLGDWSSSKVWPLEIPVGGFLEEISVAQTSQFASAGLIAAAGKMYSSGESQSICVKDSWHSFPYFSLTRKMLNDMGVAVVGDNPFTIPVQKNISPKNIPISLDASALSYYEIFYRYYHKKSLYTEYAVSSQGDGKFPVFLDDLIQCEKECRISLTDHPDLAPSLWAAAILFQKKLTVHSTPQLCHKECDRSDALVVAAKKLSLPSEVIDGGFYVDGGGGNKAQAITLDTRGDHRLAMAFALVQTKWLKTRINNHQCVEKSFPRFWEGLSFMKKTIEC